MKPRAPTTAELTTPGRVIINRKQLLQKIPLSERTILEMERRGEFPQRFTITARLVGWDLAEIDQWIAAHHAAHHKAPSPGTKPT